MHHRFGVNYVPSKNWYYCYNNWDKRPIRQDIAQIAELGADHIRIMLIWPWLQPNPTVMSQHQLDHLDDIMEAASAENIDVMPSIYTGWLSGFQFKPNFYERKPFYTDDKWALAQSFYLQSLSTRLKRHHNFLGFDIGNEIGCIWSGPNDIGDAWMARVFREMYAIFPDHIHVNGVDHTPWFRDKDFSAAALMRLQKIAPLHGWPFWVKATQYGGPLDRPYTHLIAGMASLARSLGADPQKPMWAQEFGVCSLEMPERDIPRYLEIATDAGIAAGVSWFTWWSSHDVNKKFEFHPFEYSLGLIDTNNRIKEQGKTFRRIADRYRGQPVAIPSKPYPHRRANVAMRQRGNGCSHGWTTYPRIKEPNRTNRLATSHNVLDRIRMKSPLFLLCASLLASQGASAADAPTMPVKEVKRIYIAPDDHTDYMWTGDEEDYRRVYVEMIDYYLDLADKTQSAPPEFRSRWHNDGSYWMWTYEKNKTPAQFQRLINRVKDGTMSFPLNTVVSTYGGTPMEAVLRDMYYAGSLERRFKIKVPLAIAMENQTLPYGLGALWAGSGAKYSWKGICGCLTELDRTGRRPHEIYWWTAEDGSRVLMKWNSLTGDTGARSMGGYAEARTAAKEIAHVDTNADFKKRYQYPVIGIFGKGWDDLKTLTDEFPKIAREQTTPERKVIVSNMVDFFQDFERNYGSSLPNYSASFGNEWDLYTASVTEVSSRVRRAVERLRPAEAMASLVSIYQPQFMTPRTAQAQKTWLNLGLFWEHNWTADSLRVPREMRANWGRKIAGEVEGYVNDLHRDAAYALGGMIKTQPGAQRFYVFNPLGWERSDAADINFDSTAPVHIVDIATGEEVPHQLEHKAETGFPNGRQSLRIWANNLPAVGYKVYEIRSGVGKTFTPAATLLGSEIGVTVTGPTGEANTPWARGNTANVIENSFYKIKVEARGAISSWIDKTRNNREFAGALHNGRWKINDLGQDIGELNLESVGPVSVTLKAVGKSPLAHTTRITLYRDSPRVDIRNEITENFDGTHTWGFAFNLKSPDVHHEEVGAIAHAKLLADGGHYSPVMSRLEWLTLNHFADMSGEGDVGVTLSNADLAFMKLGKSGIHEHQSKLDTVTPQIQVLAGGQIDAPQAGVAKQGGDTHFLQRFALTTHGRYNAANAMRFALEHQNPPVTEWLRESNSASPTILPETMFSLLSNSNPDVLLWTLKPAEDGAKAGLISRVWNVGGAPQDYRLTLNGGIHKASKTTHIETDIEFLPVKSGAVTSHANATQIQTLRLVPVKSNF